MFCPKCGNELPKDAAFCGVCGAGVKKRTPEPEPAAKPVMAAAKESSARLNQKLVAVIAAIVVAVVVIVVAVGSYSSNGGSTASPESAASSRTYSGKLGKLVALSNDELASTLESDGFAKSGNTYTKGEIEIELDNTRGERIITMDKATFAYTVLNEEGPGFDQLGAYFRTASSTEFSVGVCDVAGGKGVVVGSGGPSGCLVMVFEPGHFGNLSEIANNVSFSNSMSAEEAAKVFVDGLGGNGFEHVDGDNVGKMTSSSANTSSGTVSSSSVSVATHDMLTGTVRCNGGNAPDAVNAIVISDDEILIKGKLTGDAVGKNGSKTWSFGIDKNTQFGAIVGNQGFKEQPKDEMIRQWEVGNFPSLVLELENGMVKRIYQSS